MTHTPGKVQVFNVVHPDRGGAMTPDEIGKYIADAVRKTIAEGGGLTDRFLEISMADDPQLFLCHVGNGPAGLDNAQRIKALWNAAEELELTTEAIIEGTIQRTFTLAESRAGVIEAALERIEKLEAENAVMLEVLEFANSRLICGDGDCYCMEFNLDEYLRILAAIRKAGGEE